MANKNIRGITIEIDGNTSKLGNALQDVEKQTRKTNSELRDIEKNLKFNPGNTELVSQQQRNLQKVIAETKDKLSILKEADKQAKTQLANGEIGQEQYDALQREIIATEKYLSSYEKRLDSSQKEQEAFAKATGDITKVLEGSGKSIEDFADVLGEDVVEAYKKGEGSSEQMQDALNKLAREFENSGDDIEKYGVKFDKLGDEAKESKEDIDSINDTAISVVGLDSLIDLFSGLKDTVIDAAKAIQEAWSELDDAQDTIIAKTGANEESQKKLGKVFDNIYRRMPVEAQKVGDAIGELNTQFAFQDETLEKNTERLLQFAEINGTDVTQTTQQAKEVIAQFNLKGEDFGKVLDVITKAGQDTGVSVDKLMSTMTDGAPVLQDLNLSFDESAVMLSTFEQNGINSSKALGMLTKAQAAGAKDGKNLTQVMKEFNKMANSSINPVKKTEAAAKLFGTKGGAMMLKAAQDGAFNFKELGEKAKGAEGKVTETYNNILDPADTFMVAQNNIKTAFSDISNTVQEMLAPAFEQVSKWLQEFVSWFTELPDGIKRAVVIIAGISGALLTVAVAIGVIKTALALAAPFLGTLTAGFGTVASTITALLAPIGLVVGAFITLWNTNEEFKNNILGIWEIIQNTFNELVTGIQERLGGLQEAFQSVINFIKPIWIEFCNVLAPVFETAFYIISEVFTAVKDTILGILDIFIGIFTGNWEQAWNGVKSIFESVWQAIENIITYVIESIGLVIEKGVNFVSTTVTSVWNTLKSTVIGIWNAMGGSISAVWGNIKSIVSGAVNGIKSTVTSVFTTLKNTVTDTWNGIKNAIWKPIEWAKNKVKGIVDAIKGFFSFEFSWPHIPMPHFGIKPKGWRIGDLLKGKIPSLGIDWYAQGGIFEKPSVIGVGEAGSEAVVPTHKLDAFLAEGVERVLKRIKGTENKQPQIVINIDKAEVRNDNDIQKIAAEVIRQIDLKTQRNKLAKGLL